MARYTGVTDVDGNKIYAGDNIRLNDNGIIAHGIVVFSKLDGCYNVLDNFDMKEPLVEWVALGAKKEK